MDYPQVILFGSIAGDWREDVIIPVLKELGVTYFDPVSKTGWNVEMGDNEADMMAHCETIIFVVNTTTPAFTSLAETGWAALGAQVRGQTFILQIDQDYDYSIPESLLESDDGKRVQGWLQHWVKSSRYLVSKHASEFDIPNLHLVDTVADIPAILREKYG